jgi:hypothetical protein
MDADNHFGFVVDSKEFDISTVPVAFPTAAAASDASSASTLLDMAGNSITLYDTVAYKSGNSMRIGIIREVGSNFVCVTPLDVLTGSHNIWTKRGSNTRKLSYEIVKMQLPATSKIIT